ncbi:zinc-binding dehydrogenase [Acetobacter sp. DsW_063]|uniref:zinc-binding dehydrogenase n=1 Tax=Acetobacter sp. DsW_063 TaxID=1514894 RepID=UPI000A38D2E0|nr:zinc-binding dehydrogenase [Acetobacter sp. DsW_063]OUJ15584.1 Zn-dependent oxidoreductase [Acetobacter sp. DsW_063]
MKAICVTKTRQLEVREVPSPTSPPDGHILVDIAAAAINHGDKTFLSRPTIAAGLKTSLNEIWGASASGRVREIGNGVPAEFLGKNVALYRSLTSSPHIVGLWSEQAVVPCTSAIILPDSVLVEDYSGSLVNTITGYAYLEEALSEERGGIIVTAGASATGLAISAIARRKQIPVLALVRSEQAGEILRRSGAEHVLCTKANDFERHFSSLADRLGATAVFDGVGGELINRIAPLLPSGSTVSFYGFLGGASPISIPSALFVTKTLEMKGFSNFNSVTVKDAGALRGALAYLEGIIIDPLFRTQCGERFSFDEIEDAMAYETRHGARAVLVPKL